MNQYFINGLEYVYHNDTVMTDENGTYELYVYPNSDTTINISKQGYGKETLTFCILFPIRSGLRHYPTLPRNTRSTKYNKIYFNFISLVSCPLKQRTFFLKMII